MAVKPKPQGEKYTPMPKPPLKSRVAPTSDAARQDQALKDLMKKRAAEAKRTGLYPNYNTN
jgi:hypothetical protein